MTHESATGEFPGEPVILNYINQKHSLKPLWKMPKGHTGTALYVCQDSDGMKKVVKFGLTDLSREEVKNNIHGYDGIRSAGGIDLLPPNISFDTLDQSPIIVMDFLGNSLTELLQQRQQSADEFDIFVKSVKKVVQKSITLNNHEQINGIDEIKSQIQRWWKPIINRGVLPQGTDGILDQVNSEDLTSDCSCLSILDFTPDNFFIFNGRIIFIDPWKQKTYRGSLLPALAQFITLSKDIYNLPAIKERGEDSQELIAYTGSLLNLERKQIAGQVKLGSALQFALSSFVRIESNPKLAFDFAIRSYKLVQSI